MDYIVILDSKNTLTEGAFLAKHNSKFSINNASVTTAIRSRSQREGTQEPIVVKLALKFSTPARNGGGEFVVGSGETADIRIGSQGEGVSARHLLIGFDSNKNVTVKDVSSRGSRILYSGHGNTEYQMTADKHNPSPWVIPGGWTVRITVASYVFELRRPGETNSREYVQKVGAFMQAARQNPLMFLSNLALSSGPHTVVGTPRPAGVRKAYIRGAKLGEGGTGCVYKMYDSSTWEPVAGKLFSNATHREEELQILLKLNHPKIARYLSPVTHMPGNQEMLIVMEYFELGDLYDVHKRKPLSLFEIVQVTVQACEVLEYIHSPRVNVVHRDIKPGNILVRSRSKDPRTGLYMIEIALTDFGCGKWNKTNMSTVVGTPLFAAPEVCLETSYTSAVDIYSLGMMLLYLLRIMPNPTASDYDMYSNAYAKRVQQHMARLCKVNQQQINQHQIARSDLYELLSFMVSLDATKRPTALECKELALDIYQQQVSEATKPTSAPPTAPQPPPAGPPKRQGTNMSQTGAAPPRKKAPVQAQAAASSSRAQGQQPPTRTAVTKPVKPEANKGPKKDSQTATLGRR